MTTAKTRVLILCTANSARSQMAEGLLRQLAGDRVVVESAGSVPSRVHPLATRAMAERGIDLSGHRSKGLDEFLGLSFDWVITVCDHAARSCPAFPGPARRVHWGTPDPAPPSPEGEAEAETDESGGLDAFRQARDRLEKRLQAWIRAEL